LTQFDEFAQGASRRSPSFTLPIVVCNVRQRNLILLAHRGYRGGGRYDLAGDFNEGCDMRLIGMLDSPYVRRVAVSLKLMGLPFVHEPLSVFRDYDRFAAINPAVKAPTFVTDAGVVLVDSGLILDHIEHIAPPVRSLMPHDPALRERSLRLTGLALAACEKSVSIVYERNLRPPEKAHEPWLERVRGQLFAAFGALEDEIDEAGPWLVGDRPMQADVAAAVAWRFTHFAVSDLVWPRALPKLETLSARAEALEAFAATPPG
jgi:glutathione S-transferase